MKKTSKLLISVSCFLSLLCFIPSPVDLSYKAALSSRNVYISFFCVAISSFPMILDCLLDSLSEFGFIKLGSFDNRAHLFERWVILIGFIYPTIGYLILSSLAPNQLGVYYMCLTNSQTIWLGGAFLAIIQTSQSDIWTFKWALSLIGCLTGLSVLSKWNGFLFSTFYYLFGGAGTMIFLYLYVKTIISVRRKQSDKFSSEDYFCIMYSTLILIVDFVFIIVATILYEMVGDEVTIIYVNISATLCIALITMIHNRRAEQIKLESTEQSLATNQAFVCYLSHELRTPINVVMVGLSMHEQYLEERNLLTADSKETLADMKGAIQVALETLNEALTFEKLQSKVMALDKKIEDPLSFVLSCSSMFKTTALDAGIQLILPEAVENLSPEYSCIEVDPHKMSQVMRNILSNAIKFSPPGSSIDVSMRSGDLGQLVPAAETNLLVGWTSALFGTTTTTTTTTTTSTRRVAAVRDPWLEISVRDEGVGIASENLPRIFNEVLQIDPNKNQGGKGSGLGLYISKGITELHGGRVSVLSDGLGKGCCFKVLLPLRKIAEWNPTALPKLVTMEKAGHDINASPTVLNSGSRRDVNQSKVLPFSFDLEEQSLDRVAPVMTRESNSSPRTTRVSSSFEVQVSSDDESSLLFLKSPSPQNMVDNDGDVTALRIILPNNIDSTSHSQVEGGSPVKSANSNGNAVPRANSASIPLQLPTDAGSGRLHGLKILMVDDSAVNLRMCVKLFRKMGAEVDEAADGAIALDMVQALWQQQQHRASTGDDGSRLYDAVVMDNLMPRMSGPEACKAMRALGFKGLVIGLTGNALERDIAAYVAQGATTVLRKPLVLEELFDIFRENGLLNCV